MTTRILLVAPVLDGIGPGRSLANLAYELPALGYEPILACTHGPRESLLIDEARAAGIEVAHLGMAGLLDPRGPLNVMRLVRRTGARIVHTRTPRADITGRAAALVGAKVLNNIISLPPDDMLVWHGERRGRKVLILYRVTRGPVKLFVANAHALVEPIVATYGVAKERVRVVHDGIPIDVFTRAAPADLAEFGFGADEVVVFTAARLYPPKGLEVLVEAAGPILAERPDVRFLIVGEGPLREPLEAEIERSGLTGRIVLPGWRNDVHSLMAAADLFVLPSRFEGLPNAVIEAMAAGLPVVSTTVSGIPELLEHGRTGWLVAPGDAGALANAVLTALRGDAAAIGARAAQRAREHFSSAAMARSFAEIYAELLT